jgi:hypothetical protein
VIFRNIILLFIVVIFSNSILAQRIITGKVLDFHSKSTVHNVDVSIYKGTSTTTTNSHGFFQLTVSNDDSLLITHPGYKIGIIRVPEVDVFSVYIQGIDVFPTYLDGEAKLYSYLQQNLKHPRKSLIKSVEGMLLIQVQVDSSGSIASCKALNELCRNCAKDAIEVFMNIPGKWSESHETTSFVFPIIFKIDFNSDPVEFPKVALSDVKVMEIIYISAISSTIAN